MQVEEILSGLVCYRGWMATQKNIKDLTYIDEAIKFMSQQPVSANSNSGYASGWINIKSQLPKPAKFIDGRLTSKPFDIVLHETERKINCWFMERGDKRWFEDDCFNRYSFSSVTHWKLQDELVLPEV